MRLEPFRAHGVRHAEEQVGDGLLPGLHVAAGLERTAAGARDHHRQVDVRMAMAVGMALYLVRRRSLHIADVTDRWEKITSRY